MRMVLTLLCVILLSTAGLAQTAKDDKRVKTISRPVNLEKKITLKLQTEKGQAQLARLYRYKNSRIKRALAFTIRNNNFKLA